MGRAVTCDVLANDQWCSLVFILIQLATHSLFCKRRCLKHNCPIVIMGGQSQLTRNVAKN